MICYDIERENEFSCSNIYCDCYGGFETCVIKDIERKFLVENFKIPCPTMSCVKNKEKYHIIIERFREFQNSLEVIEKLTR